MIKEIEFIPRKYGYNVSVNGKVELSGVTLKEALEKTIKAWKAGEL